MKTQTSSKKAITGLLSIMLLSCQNILAQENALVEDTPPTHSVIFIFSILFFIIGFAILLILKLRNDKKEKEEEEEAISHPIKRHHHPNHYGHHHQYRH